MRSVDHAQRLRDLVETASAENARMVAAAMGGHLAALLGPAAKPDVEGAVDLLRDRTLALLTDLSRGDPASARGREGALRAVDALDLALLREPAPVAPPPREARAPRLGMAALLSWFGPVRGTERRSAA